MVQLTSPGVLVTVEDNSGFAETAAGTVPLIFLATRKNKASTNGVGIAAGTAEANVLRSVISQKDVIAQLGTPTFVTSDGAPVHGDETNEYGLHALWSIMGTSALAYYVRGDVDVAGLMPAEEAPTNPVDNGTYWIEEDEFVGGFYRRNSANTAWVAVPSSIYTTAPANGDGSVGDIAIDYSTSAGTIKVKSGASTWTNISAVDITSVSGGTATNNIWISDAAPTGAAAYDYWWKTVKTGGGYDLKLRKYVASSQTWDDVVPIRSVTQPTTLTAGTVWEDISTTTSDGAHPLKVSNGTTFSALTVVIDAAEPRTAPVDGDLWYSDDYTDFKLYKEATDVWVEIATVTDSTPSATEKVISASAPSSPSTGAYWIDTSDLELFPVIKRYNGAGWENITDSVLIDGTFRDPTAVANGTVWLNLAAPETKFTVKRWTDDYEPPVVNSGGDDVEAFDEATHGRWAPYAGAKFGRHAQRQVIVNALQEAVATTEGITDEAISYQLIAAPGYTELYDDLASVNASIKNRAFIIADVPLSMKASGTVAGREILANTWRNNLNSISENGEGGFVSSGTEYSGAWYPHGLMSNSDGSTVCVPSSTLGLKLITYSDSIDGKQGPAFGIQHGAIPGVAGLGYVDSNGDFKYTNVSDGDAGVLYGLNINPIRNLFRVGIRAMGNKTFGGTNSKLGSIHVARLVSSIATDLQSSLRIYLRRPHDRGTWAEVENDITRYLAGRGSQRELEDWAVRCDQETNTAARRNRKELWAEVAIIPTGAVEFIYVPIQVEESGATL